MTNNEAAKWIQLYIDLAKIDPTTGEAAYLNDDDKKTIEAMEMAINALTAQPETHEKRTETHACDYINRKDAIEAHYEYCNKHPDAGFPVWSLKILKDLPSAQPEQRWIPCSEGLPEQYGNYLVSYRTDDFESDIGTFDPDRINSDTGEWSACDANGFYWVASKGLEVIAWMPLPEPYKGGEQDG